MLILMIHQCAAECIVRQEHAKDKAFIIDLGNVTMKNPVMVAFLTYITRDLYVYLED